MADELLYASSPPNVVSTDIPDTANRYTAVTIMGKQAYVLSRPPGATTIRRESRDLAAGTLVEKYRGCVLRP
jgi:hypothetical protein